MAFYDDLDEKFARFGRGVVRKTKGICKSARLSRIIRQEERKQDEIFRQMGEYYYQMHGGDAEGQMKIWCDAVWNNKMMVIQYQGQKHLIKGVTYCPNCSREIPENSKFCNYCGARVPVTPRIQAGTIEPFSGKICAHCGTRVMEGHMFCSNCGNRLPEFEEVEAVDFGEEHGEKKDAVEKTEERKTTDSTEKAGLGASLKKFVRSKTNARKIQDETDQKEVEQEFLAEERAAEQENLAEEKAEEQKKLAEEKAEKQENPAEEKVEKQENLIEKNAEEVEELAEKTAAEQVRKCSACGNILEEDYNFCSKCGMKIEKGQSEC